MVFAYISIQGWIIHPDVNSFFYGSDEVLVLSPHNAEVLNGGIMTCDVLMVIYSLNLSPKVQQQQRPEQTLHGPTICERFE